MRSVAAGTEAGRFRVRHCGAEAAGVPAGRGRGGRDELGRYDFQGDYKQVLYLLYTLHVIVCLFLILVVLLQQGKGADLSVFGGGGTQAAFGPRGATTLLHKLTVWGFVAFTVLTIGIGFLTGRGRGGSVMEGVETEQSAPATPAPEPVATEAEPRATGTDPGATTSEPEAAATQPETTATQPETTPAASETPAAESRATAPEPEAGAADDGTAGATEAGDDAAPATEETSPPADAEEPESAPDETPQ